MRFRPAQNRISSYLLTRLLVLTMLRTAIVVSLLAAAAHARSVLVPRDGENSQTRQSKRGDVLMNNWCGPVKQVNQVTSVEASWAVPSVSRQQGTTDDNWFYHWVGIDGVGNCNVLLQAGTGSTVSISWFLSLQPLMMTD